MTGVSVEEPLPPSVSQTFLFLSFIQPGLSQVDWHFNEAGVERVLADNEQFSHQNDV